MEHRLDQRIEMPLKAWVNFGDMPTLITSTRNISKSGVCLAFTHSDLKVSYVMDIVFEDHHAEAHWRCKALVIHTSQRGTGVLLGRELPFAMPDAAWKFGKQVILPASASLQSINKLQFNYTGTEQERASAGN